MITVSAEFAVVMKDNVVAVIGTATIKQPNVHFTGNGIKWYQDNIKQNQLLQIISNKKMPS